MSALTVDELVARPVVNIEQAAAFLGIGRTAGYEAARTGDLPTLKLGRRLVVPTAALLALVGRPITATQGADVVPLHRPNLTEVRSA